MGRAKSGIVDDDFIPEEFDGAPDPDRIWSIILGILWLGLGVYLLSLGPMARAGGPILIIYCLVSGITLLSGWLALYGFLAFVSGLITLTGVATIIGPLLSGVESPSTTSEGLATSIGLILFGGLTGWHCWRMRDE